MRHQPLISNGSSGFTTGRSTGDTIVNRDMNTRAVWAACLGLMMIAGVGRAEDGDRAPDQNLPTAVEQPSNPVGTPARVSHHSAGSESDDCNCLACRFRRPWIPHEYSDDCNCFTCRCRHSCFSRTVEVHHHDKHLFHWYIRGNGPAIHTRPAGLYWW